jgi:hypothetical protein
MNNIVNFWNNPLHISPFIGNANTTQRWACGENLEDYLERKRKNPNLKTYLPSDFSYKFNSLGCRSEDFDNDADIKILYGGCSLTEGMGLPLEHTWHGILNNFISKEIDKPIKTFNIGIGGAGIDFVVRSIYVLIEHYNFQPDMVNLLLPPVMRKEIITELNSTLIIFKYIPGNRYMPELKELVNNYDKIISYKHQYHVCFQNLLFLKCFLKTKNIPFIFSFWDNALDKNEMLRLIGLNDNDDIKKYDLIPKELLEHYYPGYFRYDKDNLIYGNKFDQIYPYEIARDFVHFGPNAHYTFANRLYKYMLVKPFFNDLLSKWKL